MVIKAKATPGRAVKAKARQLLTFVKENVREHNDPAELFIVIFGPHGKATMMFPTKREWAAFARTDEIKEINRLLEALPVKPAR